MIKKTLFFVLLGIYQISFSAQICTDGELDNQNCTNSIPLNSYHSLESATGEYFEYSNIFLGTKDTANSVSPDFSQVPNGFLGSLRQNYTGFDSYTPVPVGHFGGYIGKDMDFPTQVTYIDDTDFSLYPLVKPVYNTQETTEISASGSLGGGVSGTCYIDAPKNLQLITKQEKTYQALEISWEKQDGVKYKVVQITPEDIVYDIGEKNVFEQVLTEENQKYQYFIVAYNDCNPGIYSDLVRYTYAKNTVSDTGYLQLDNNILTFIPPEKNTVQQIEYKLFCYAGQELILSSFFDTTLQFSLDAEYLQKNFSCEVQYLADKAIVTTSRLYYYFFPSKIYTYADLIQIIHAGDVESFYAFVSYLKKKLLPQQVVSLEGFALVMINYELGIYLSDANTAYKLLTEANILPDIGAKKSIDTQTLYNTLSYISQHREELQTELVQKLDTQLQTTYNQAFINFYFAIVSQKTLESSNISSAKKEIFRKCFLLEYCTDVDGFLSFIQDVLSRNSEPFTQNIDKNLDSKTLIEGLFSAYGYIGKKTTMSSENFEKFIDILVQAKHPETPQSLGYFEYQFAYLSIFRPNDIEHQITYLSQKHGDTILKLYDSDKQKQLLDILEKYLQTDE